MREITAYETNDGSLFVDKNEAQRHEFKTDVYASVVQKINLSERFWDDVGLTDIIDAVVDTLSEMKYIP